MRAICFFAIFPNLVVHGDDSASLLGGRVPRDGDAGGEREGGDGVGVTPQGGLVPAMENMFALYGSTQSHPDAAKRKKKN